MDFDDKFLKILCFADEATLKGLQWALDRNGNSDRRFRIFGAPMSLLGTEKQPRDMDLALMVIDLGQPVPVESLSKLSDTPGLLVFMHPTPQQLLSVFELPEWMGTTWDGVNFERVVQRLDELASQHKEKIKKKHFIEACRAWLKRTEELPDFIEWVNPPDSYLAPRLYALDTQFGILTLGFEGSGASVKFPSSIESVSGEIGEFRFINGFWSFKSFQTKLALELKGQQDRLRPGDQVIIGDHIINVRKSPRVDDFSRLARDVLGTPGHELMSSKAFSEKTLSEVIKDLLHSGVRGELRLNAGLKSGSLFFEDSKIVHARTGPVDGKKATLRMLGWDKMTWKFIENKMPVPDKRTMNVAFAEFSRLFQSWKTSWQMVSTLQPPSQLKLKANAKNFLKKRVWAQNEAQVFAALCEYSMVRDIMNFCLMDDVSIVETLVSLRKQGLVELVKN